MSRCVGIITSEDPGLRDCSLDEYCQAASAERLIEECSALEEFRRTSDNLYGQVRALFFLYAIHRFHLPARTMNGASHIPFEGYNHLLQRRYEEAISGFSAALSRHGASETICSALAAAYKGLAFQTLADQVRRSVRSVRGNQWMFRAGHPADYPLRLRPHLMAQTHGVFPVLRETTPVRMDLSHSGWSDIFFLGMDFPEGARVLNTSIDLSVRAGDGSGEARPPVEAYLRVIDEPVLRLCSVDLHAIVEIRDLSEVFDYARDYLGLLKAAVIASGLIPPGLEGSGQSLAAVLERLTGRVGHGIEIVSRVNDIPKGSRLAVSTNLLACLVSVCMRATGQIRALTGGLQEDDRRIVAARAILGEWLGGSGGGWQDSGGVWPGMKLIQGEKAESGDVEFGISRGRLLPRHRLLDADAVPEATRARLMDSLVLVHGGMAQDVGPILEMVTEKYLLRSSAEWKGRLEAMGILDEILEHLRSGNIRAIGQATQRNFDGPIQTIIPWAGNRYTQILIDRTKAEFGDKFWGFWMLGGMAGGGMGFLFDPAVQQDAKRRLPEIMQEAKKRIEGGVPFAMDPVVYNFRINERGTWAEMLEGGAALMPPGYYTLALPPLFRQEIRALPAARRAELDAFGDACRRLPEMAGMVSQVFDLMVPQSRESDSAKSQNLDVLLDRFGFDRLQHERVRTDLRSGRIGLAQNRLPASSLIEDVKPGDVAEARNGLDSERRRIGEKALAAGELAVVSLAGGIGTRWTKGAGVVKAINPFARMGGVHRSFVETHLAKSRKVSRESGVPLVHVITTSYLTHEAIEAHLGMENNYAYEGPLHLSTGRSVGLRLVPMARDLRFAWEEMPQQILDIQKQKVLESARNSLIQWAIGAGEGNDYTDNLPAQCLHPVGHWYELPNMLRNGTLAAMLRQRPQLKHLLLHNIDTVGATAGAAMLGHHIRSGAALTVEVIARQVDDRGGGLARIDGKVRLIEGLALPEEEIEFGLSYYNTGTMWIDIDRLLAVFGLDRPSLDDETRVAEAVRSLAGRMPTYVTLKDVKKRWGKGQEDIFPVTQFEKLWGDMTALPELECGYVVVPRPRGQQLKDVAQLDGWLRDGSAAYVESQCEWQ
jgi:hypothetical protein